MEFSFASGALLGGVGIATLTKIRSPRELLLGSLPLMFAVHQIEEGVVWMAMEGQVAPPVGQLSIDLYIYFAHALLPAIIPWCFWLAEPEKSHRTWLIPLVVLGTMLCAFALWKLSDGTIVAQVRRHSIEYEDAVTNHWFAAVYVIVTCLPPFLSSYPWMIRFGALNLAALIVVGVFRAIYLTSLWCAAAAVVSVLIYFHFRRAAARRNASDK